MPAASIVSPPLSSVASPVNARVGKPGKKSFGRRKTSSSPSGSHTGARAFGEIGERTEVIEMAVRQQDRRAGRAQTGKLEPDLGSVGARVDDDSFGRLYVGANEVAIRPDLAEWELFNGERHGRMSLSLPSCRPGT